MASGLANAPPRHHSPHPSKRIFHIACVAGHQMDVDVRDALTGCIVDVDAYIEAIGLKTHCNKNQNSMAIK